MRGPRHQHGSDSLHLLLLDPQLLELHHVEAMLRGHAAGSSWACSSSTPAPCRWPRQRRRRCRTLAVGDGGCCNDGAAGIDSTKDGARRMMTSSSMLCFMSATPATRSAVTTPTTSPRITAATMWGTVQTHTSRPDSPSSMSDLPHLHWIRAP